MTLTEARRTQLLGAGQKKKKKSTVVLQLIMSPSAALNSGKFGHGICTSSTLLWFGTSFLGAHHLVQRHEKGFENAALH